MATDRVVQNNMSVAHSGVSFNHSCLKVPVDPTSKKPSPNYERIYNHKLSADSNKIVSRDRRETSAVSSTNSSLGNNYRSVESYLQFYETIPDYSELHHLSDEEFYSRLKSLKITQKRFCSGDMDGAYHLVDRPSSHSSIGYDPRPIYSKTVSPKKGAIEARVSSGYSNSTCSRRMTGTEDARPEKRVRRSRIKQKNSEDLGKMIKSWKEDVCMCLSDNGFCCRKFKSMPGSTSWKPETCRYDSDVCECLLRNREMSPPHYPDDSSNLKNQDSRKNKFTTRPVPLLSRIPLYEKIMSEQEERRRANHNRYSKELRALVQPFSFTKREEEEKQRLRMTCSNPELNAPTAKRPTFKAKPIPRSLFSNYAYERMKEEDFYRALRKRIRAEELLKSSSLPPSMAAREKYKSKSLDSIEHPTKLRAHRRACDVLRREIAFDENRAGKRRGKPFWLNRKPSITDSSTEVSPYGSVSEPDRRYQKRPHSAISINRSNLASVLRMQTVRKRMEKEMAENLEESRLKQQAKFKEKLIRMTPAWKALNYSTEGDLALRVASRREEDRLKKKRYDKLMGSIYGRVHQIPPLFQRQFPSRKEMMKKRDQQNGEDYGYNKSYFDKSSPRKRAEDVEPNAASKYRNHFRKSSESSSSHEGTKMDESDVETGSHIDEIVDYMPEQTKKENGKDNR